MVAITPEEMINSLFGDMPESLSPRERWIRTNLVKVLVIEAPLSASGKYVATNGQHTAKAATYDDVLILLAQVLYEQERIPPWNQQKKT